MPSKMHASPTHPPLYSAVKKSFLYMVVILCMSTIKSLAQSNKKLWSNPILIYGSHFGRVFQQLYLNSNYQMMLKLRMSTTVNYSEAS